MQEALENIFGPAAGLLGIVMFAAVLLPKFIVRWRGMRAKKREKREKRRENILGSRALRLTPVNPDADEHAVHGVELRRFSNAAAPVLIESLCYIIPLILVLIFVPTGYRSLYIMLLVTTIPIAVLGLINLRHLGDRAVFYRTGFEMYLKRRRYSIDYNAVISYTERKSLIPGLPPCYILHLDDERLFVIDGIYYKSGRRLDEIFANLGERVIRSAADEQKRLL